MSDGFQASDIMNADIKNKAGETIGSIEDIVVNADGKAVGIVADVGGFLGVRQRDVLLDWKSVTIQQSAGTLSVTTDLDKSTIGLKQPYKLSSN
jgi:sporulation protein YlmC with PRC-barrel domain